MKRTTFILPFLFLLSLVACTSRTENETSKTHETARSADKPDDSVRKDANIGDVLPGKWQDAGDKESKMEFTATTYISYYGSEKVEEGTYKVGCEDKSCEGKAAANQECVILQSKEGEAYCYIAELKNADSWDYIMVGSNGTMHAMTRVK